MIAPLLFDAALGFPSLLVWAIDTLIVTSLLVALVIAARRPVAQAFGPHVAYLLWAIPAARLLLPPLPQLLPNFLPAESPAMPTVHVAVFADAAGPGLASTIAAAVPAGWPWLLLLLWLGGAAATLGWQALVHRRLLAAIERAETVGWEGRVRVLISDAVHGPVSFGLLHPVIVLPSDALLPLTPAERRLAIAHELEHHRHGDLWANAFAVLFAALHWFNPLVRGAWRRFRFDQEAACDARVLACAERADRGTYARTLAKAASGHPSAFASPMIAPDRLKERIAMMIEPAPSPARRRLGAALAAAFLVGTLGLTATPVLADPPPVALPAPASPPAPPAPPVPHPDGATTVEIVNDNGRHTTRIVRRDGRTVVVRSDRRIDPGEVDRIIREEAPGADADDGARERRIIIRERRDAAPSREEISAIVDDARAAARTAEVEARAQSRAEARAALARVRIDVARIRADVRRDVRLALRTANAATVADCRGAARIVVARTGEDGADEHRPTVLSCAGGSLALQLHAMRSARHALAAMDGAALPAEHRAEALAELDEAIADVEAEIADRQN